MDSNLTPKPYLLWARSGRSILPGVFISSKCSNPCTIIISFPISLNIFLTHVRKVRPKIARQKQVKEKNVQKQNEVNDPMGKAA